MVESVYWWTRGRGKLGRNRHSSGASGGASQPLTVSAGVDGKDRDKQHQASSTCSGCPQVWRAQSREARHAKQLDR